MTPPIHLPAHLPAHAATTPATTEHRPRTRIPDMPSTTDVGHRTHTIIDSPIGPLTLVAREGVLIGLYMREQRHRPDAATFGHEAAKDLTTVAEQLGEYFAGDRTSFDLSMDAIGTSFQRTVWAALRDIPYGQTISYGQLAARIGRPTASRAVGLANGRNPLSIVVPCHRVVASSGKLTGYGGGIERKRLLLALERRWAQPSLEPTG
jgi:methylated-DNA-[protein]-cysteine S-methyltransferase